MSLKEQVAGSAEWCVGVKVCTQQLNETTEADRVGGLRNGRPQCRSHSRLSKGEQTFNIFGVNTHTHLCCLRAAPAIARRVRNRPATCTRRSCAIFSPVPRPSDTSQRVGPAVVQVAPNLTRERPRRAFLSATTATESTLTRHVWGLSFARLPNRSSLRFLAADTVRTIRSHFLLEHHYRLQACHCVHAFPYDLAAFNGPRQVSRQATSRNPGGLQGSWFPASLTRKTYEDQDLGWHIATAALPCPCCPDRSCSTTGRGKYEAYPPSRR